MTTSTSSTKTSTKRSNKVRRIIAIVLMSLSIGTTAITTTACNPLCLVTKPGDGFIPDTGCGR